MIGFAFAGEETAAAERKLFFSAQAGRFYFISGCFTLDRCTGTDMTFADPDGLLVGVANGSYGWFVLSGSTGSAACGNRLLSWDPLDECP